MSLTVAYGTFSSDVKSETVKPKHKMMRRISLLICYCYNRVKKALAPAAAAGGRLGFGSQSQPGH